MAFLLPPLAGGQGGRAALGTEQGSVAGPAVGAVAAGDVTAGGEVGSDEAI